jgi:RHS repeat-associated protein
VGIGDFVSDLTPDSVENVVKKGEEWVGDRVEDAGDWTADRLEDVGWDSGADWVREQSRSVANRLGAEVDEMDLGQTEDKTKLIYGSPSKLRSTATHLRNFQKAFDTVGDGLKGLDAAHLKGRAADAFRGSVHIQPPKWYRGADACEDAAKALESFAETVTWAQGQAQDAIDAWKEGTKASKDAADAHKKKVDDYNKAVDHYNSQPADKRDPSSLPPKPGEFHDPGKAKMQHAQEILSEARKQRNSAADTVRASLRKARDMAPPKPSYAHQVGDGFTELQYMQDHFDGGLLKGTAGLLNFARSVNPLDPYNITHPAQYLTGLDNLAAGLVKTANDPWGAGRQMLSDFLKDPSEGLGRLVPDIVLTVATDGAGAGVKAARTADEAADAASAARRTVRPHDEDLGTAGRKAEDTPCTGEPVDVVTGAMLMQHTDLTLPAAGLPLVFERTHLSSYRGGTAFGPTWCSLLDEQVQLDAEGAVFAGGDGMRLVYPVPVPGEPVLPVKGARWPLEWDGTPHGAITVTDPTTGTVRTFTQPVPGSEPGTMHLLLESIHDRNGARVDLDRTTDGAPAALRHSGGYHVAIDTEGPRVTALRLLERAPSPYEPVPDDSGGTVVTRYRYDDAGNLAEVVNSSGEALRFTADEQGRVTSWADRNGTTFAYVYDERGRVTRTEGSDGVFNGTFTYDEANRTTCYTDSLGHTTRHHYNTDGQVVAETDPLGNTTRTVWNDRGDLRESVTDPLGRTTRYEHDEAGNLTCVHLPDGTTARAAYNHLGLPVEVIEPGGATWRHTYDEAGNPLTTVDPAGAETHYAYNDRGHLTAATDALGHTRTLTCDDAGLPVAFTDALGHTTTLTRDAFGRVTTVTDPLGTTTRTHWTIEGKPSRRDHPDGTHETWTWDGEGNLLSHTDPAGHTTRHTHGHFGVPATRTEADGTTHHFAYDTELRLTQVTNPAGLTWTYTYDPAGRLTGETDFNGRTLTYTHNPAGELLTRTNGAGQTLIYARDALGRTTEQRTDTGQTTTYTYDPQGALIHAANPDADITIARDPLGRPLSETVNGRTTTYTYDRAGRRTQRTTPSGLTSTWSYDADGRPAELHTPGATLAFAYDAAGREVERRFGDGVTLTQTWDRADRMTTQTLTRRDTDAGADRLLQHRSYAYRADSHPTEIRELTSGTRHFSLDPAGRVTAVTAHGWSESYAYDTTGNLTHATAPAHASPGDREFTGTLVRRAGRARFEHDGQGRLVRRARTTLSGKQRVWTFQWDAEDRVTHVETPDGDHWRYVHDPLGRRIRKQRVADDGTVVEHTEFTWDGSRLAEQSPAGARVTTWDYSADTHRPLIQTSRPAVSGAPGPSRISVLDESARAEAGGQCCAVVTDPLGTPCELITADGLPVWQRRTSLWGTSLPAPAGGDGVDCPLRFPGQYADQETGLHYNHFRYYDPETAAYLSPDPLGLEPAPNPYAYVSNPLGWADPLGLAPRGPKDPLDLGSGYRGRVDMWQEGTKGTDFEIHVYDGAGREVGIFGSDGWFNKHGTTAAEVRVPPNVENALKGKSIDIMRRTGRIGPKGTEDISGDKWRRPRLASEGCK